ncbi:MAG TPA: tetratricopeptide repeat protein [Edaphobacter sp.]|nr:tetratricopeptide repeat protein [Edaphobacter sp.]
MVTISVTYANSFQNGFHFDDFHTIVDNPSIRELRNIPHFFTDATTFSVLPANRTYRPFVSTSLAIDYSLGHGYNPFWFHLSTFFFFLLQLTAMQFLFTAIFDATNPDKDNILIAAIAVAWYGLHPAMAETVNYIIQRGDIFSTVGVVLALAIFVRLPRLRATGLYLFPFAFALLSKPAALVFPVLLYLYLTFFEPAKNHRWLKPLLQTGPSIIVCIALMALQSAMTPKTFAPSIISTFSYCITQPFVLLRYFGSFFMPIHLNVDTDLQPFPSLNLEAVLGLLFVAALLVVAFLTSRRRLLKPISFGLLWFLITSIPTSVYRLSEVENDHRMYLPFVGLVLAVTWAPTLLVEHLATKATPATVYRTAAIVVLLLLTASAYGTRQRNKVWRTDETLWLDDVEKSPHNGRGLMNYGLTQMEKGNYPTALDYFQRALIDTPNYATLEINLGIVNGAMNNEPEAERHFLRAISLSPNDDQTHFYYGRWLFQTGRAGQAIKQLESASQLNPSRLESRNLLAEASLSLGNTTTMQASDSHTNSPTQGSDYWINISLTEYQKKNYQASIDAAHRALQFNPNSELAYNNLGAAYAALGQWDLAIRNDRQALRLKPNFQLAQNNLAWALSQKSLAPTQH